jgi:hypothetical protein
VYQTHVTVKKNLLKLLQQQTAVYPPGKAALPAGYRLSTRRVARNVAKAADFEALKLRKSSAAGMSCSIYLVTLQTTKERTR